MSDCVSTVVQKLSVLAEGDHIKWKRLAGYDHHAIVERVDHEAGKVHVIEYGSDKGGSSFGKGVVRRYEVDDMKRLYKYIYDECDDTKEVLDRAKSKLGERKYGPLHNNCEHFATWCKTGEENCSQIPSFAVRAVLCGVDGVSGGFGTAVGSFMATCAATAAKNATTIATEIKTLFCCGAKNALKATGKAIVNGRKAVGMNGLKAGCSVAWLGVANVVAEVCLFGYNCYKAQKKYKAAIQHAENDDEVQRCKSQRNRNIKEAACEGVAAAVLGTAVGAALGSFIPVVGTAIGAIAGNIAGRFIGRWFARRFIK